ncbi:hypothetical protein L332_12325 [Agrococcus pavilionensis RW1]|uniref:Uncharacterized protein n=1 Tax=Agrococcus pavilionensis RW1 TaxID=1330458 RepID=U1MTE8_9MICO|nr:hypothetical protein L332_12325 [Agrococcus pavilionensis RW1]
MKRRPTIVRQLAKPVSRAPKHGEFAERASSGASQGRSARSTATPSSRESTATCTWRPWMRWPGRAAPSSASKRV